MGVQVKKRCASGQTFRVFYIQLRQRECVTKGRLATLFVRSFVRSAEVSAKRIPGVFTSRVDVVGDQWQFAGNAGVCVSYHTRGSIPNTRQH